MIALQLIPVVLSLLVLGAHFLRAQNLIMVGLVAGLLLLLAVPRRWAARLVQVALVLGAAEWTITLIRLAAWRAQAGQPYLRLVAILAAVAVLTGFSALVFRTERLRRWYRGGDAS
jgi:hypothetical protein